MKFCAVCNTNYPDTEKFCPNDGEVLQESPESIVGQVIDGKYKVEGFIAQGGMGAVYRARHILLGDEVVIKTLRSEMRNNAEWLKRFQREGKAARAFRHPNSVTVYDLSAGSDGMIYMVMEYVEGHTLDRELKSRGRFSPAEALEVLEPVADVLDAAHARGVVHRDLKPENIMLGADDRGHSVVKVLDLGIAKIVGATDLHATNATSLTVAGQILGTPYYMSPEQWGEMPRDGNPEVDGRTDIYSLGVIFFELIAGSKPLGGRTLSELRHKHVSEALPTLTEISPEVPVEFSRAISRATAKDRGDRPQTAGELVDELRKALGLPPRVHIRGIHATDAGQVHVTDAGHTRGPRPPSQGGGSEAATANLKPGAARDYSGSPPTYGFDAPSDVGLGRGTSDQSARATGGNSARRESVKETIAGRHSSTQSTSSDELGLGELKATRAASHQGATPQGLIGNAGAQAGAGVNVVTPVPRRSFVPLVVGGLLVLLLVGAGVGWFAWRLTHTGGAQPTPTPLNVNTSEPPKPPVAPKVDAASYWFEAFDKKDDAQGRRVAETAATLQSGQYFRFHFMPKERGYLYIIGPGANGNAQMTMLTAQGAGQLKSNLVGAGADFAFPFGTRLQLDKNPGADDFTFIFSPTPLMSPSFFNGKFLHELTPAEVKELEDFRAQFKASAPTVEVKGEGGDRAVVVNAPQSATTEGKPLIFDLRIDHR
jgi:serine/threonine-protein kinase